MVSSTKKSLKDFIKMRKKAGEELVAQTIGGFLVIQEKNIPNSLGAAFSLSKGVPIPGIYGSSKNEKGRIGRIVRRMKQKSLKKQTLSEEIVLVNLDSPDQFTTQKVIQIIEDGLSIVVFRELCDFLEVSDKALAEIIKIPISTLAKRKKRGHFSSTESERIYRILNLYKQALDTFDGNEEYARKWLKEDAYGLGGVPPLYFAKTELGAKEVEQLLIRIDEGIFA